MALAEVSLDDKYTCAKRRIFLTGTQALVRLLLMQRARDAAAGLTTAGFVSGYRGSPLGGLDRQLDAARPQLDHAGIHHWPGVNEDLAATAVWGSQQGDIFGDFACDGVFAMWYAKGPGVDRSGDALRHGNLAGSARHGGVLLVAGDDHAARSSTTAHQCEHAFADAMIPVLAPASVQDILDFGLIGWAMSRASGCWVAMKTVADTVETAAVVEADPQRVAIRQPSSPGPLNIRWPDPPVQQEERLHREKLYAALAFARANGVDRRVLDSPKRRFGIVTVGKAYLDLMQALEDLGLDAAQAAEIGLSVYKVGLAWPLEREGVRRFAEGLEEILVVEEKRAVVENQLKEQLYNWRAEVRPRVIGKFDETGAWCLPSYGELTPARIARVLADRIARRHDSPRIAERLAFLDAKARTLAQEPPPLTRRPYFCAGCPHNTGTRVPEGSRALAGIGCHYMAQWMDRNTRTYTHMGAEGVPWIGQAPFSKTRHVFANLGDGTYFHSGILAVRACVAAGVTITFKLLYNDAVAMTGGQAVDGPLDPVRLTRQLAAEGVADIRVVSDDPGKYPRRAGWAPGVRLHHRRALAQVQTALRETPGVSVLIYDQTCAAELRRRRKRGSAVDAPRRVFINEEVCEGCGDCQVKSNCVAVVPKETAYGTKRAIDQSSCNKDFSCLNGFCPSFVTVEGGRPAVRAGPADDETWPPLPEPSVPPLDAAYGILVAGVGGTGVITVGQLLGMAAHIEGRGATVLDQTGLAQKGGAVASHVRLTPTPDCAHAARLSDGGARLLLGCDLVVAASGEVLAKLRAGVTRAVVNTHETVTADFVQNPDARFPGETLKDRVRRALAPNAPDRPDAPNLLEAPDMLDATHLATRLLGDAIATNLFLLGFAWQKGWVPLSRAALEQAVALNGVAVARNLAAFTWGRRAAVDPAGVEAACADGEESVADSKRLPADLDAVIDQRAEYLKGYQDAAYAARYRRFVEQVRAAERHRVPESGEALAWAVAHSYFKLLAIKDAYEVARLYTDGTFARKLRETFAGDLRVRVHLAPPLLSRRDPTTGEPRKRAFGPWIFPVFRVLARLRRLRGTPFDIFGYTAERRQERALIDRFERVMTEVLDGLGPANHATAVALAALPQTIRGFGPVKARAIRAAEAREAELLAEFRDPPAPLARAAE